jgi:hypothetical protein
MLKNSMGRLRDDFSDLELIFKDRENKVMIGFSIMAFVILCLVCMILCSNNKGGKVEKIE